MHFLAYTNMLLECCMLEGARTNLTWYELYIIWDCINDIFRIWQNCIRKKRRKTANVKVGFILNQSNCLRNCMLSFFLVALLFYSISVWVFSFLEHTEIGWCFITKQKREKSHGFSNKTEKKINQISCNYVLHHCTES